MNERGVRYFGGITIDCTAWPVLVWQSPPRRVSDGATADALGWLEELWRSTPTGSKSFTLADLSTMREAAPASQRKFAADFMHRNRELQARASVGGAIVATSALVRGVLTAVFWLERSTLPMRLVATREEALAYGIDLLSSACPPLPAHLLELRATIGGGANPSG